jgi:hypothetical protein
MVAPGLRFGTILMAVERAALADLDTFVRPTISTLGRPNNGWAAHRFFTIVSPRILVVLA